MYETWHVIAAYAAGTAAGIGIFHQWVKERIITMTIDSLVDQEYVRSYTDAYGVTHLHKWHDLDDLLEGAKVKIKVDGETVGEYEYDEEDDTP